MQRLLLQKVQLRGQMRDKKKRDNRGTKKKKEGQIEGQHQEEETPEQ